MDVLYAIYILLVTAGFGIFYAVAEKYEAVEPRPINWLIGAVGWTYFVGIIWLIETQAPISGELEKGLYMLFWLASMWCVGSLERAFKVWQGKRTT